MSSILSATQGQQYAQSLYPTSGSGSYIDLTQLQVQQTSTEQAEASVSLSANLNGVTAATGTGQLTLELAQALQGATQVDPATGQREIIAGANSQLTSTINSLLENNGFTSAQASAATANLASQLAQGGTINLTASFSQASQASGSLASIYGSGGASSASAVEATDRAGSLNIGINLNTGELSVALSTQSTATYQSQSEITGSGSLAAPVGEILLLPSASGSNSSAAGGAAQSDSLLNSNDIANLGNQADQGASLAPAAFGTASANSPLSESETDTYTLAELTTVSLTDYSQADNSNAQAGGTNGTGGSTGNAAGAAGQIVSLDTLQAASASYASAAASAASTANSPASAAETLKQLIAGLNKTQVLSEQEAASLLQSLAKIAAEATAASGAASAGGTAGSTASETPSGASSGTPSDAASDFTGSIGSIGTASSTQNGDSISVSIGFVQTLSIQQLDLNGYGSTLYQRPDGSLGKISTQPTHVTA
jgi:hypothetical protein